jgi:hypothetical protein
MRLFNKTIDRQLFKQYSLGSDLSKQEVVAKIFNPYGNGTWFILNSDPQDPDYLWAIVDLGYGAEVGSVSRSELENYRGRFGLGFERDLSFDPINAEELYQGLRQGEYYSHGGETEERIKQELASLDPRIKLLSELSPKEEGYEGIKEMVEKRNALQSKLLNLKGGFADGGQIEVVYERRADFKKKPIKLLLLSRGKEQKGYTFSGKDQVAVLENYNRNKQEDLERLWNLKGYETKYADGGDITEFSDNQQMIMNQNVEVEHHHEELEDILEDKIPVPAWVVAKMETATQNLSDITHYLDGQKEIMEDQLEEDDDDDDDDDDEMEMEEIENKEVVEPIVVTAGDKTEITKNFTDDAWDNLRGFLKGMEGIDLRNDYTFDYKDEQYEVEPIINSDENGVSNAVFTIFDGDGEEVGDISYSREGGKQKFTANSEFFSWNNAKFENGGFMNGVYAKGGIVDAEKVNKADEIYREHNRERKEKGIENFSKESVALWNEKYNDRLEKLKLTLEEKNALNPKKWYADGGYFDGAIPKTSSYMNTYADGGEVNHLFYDTFVSLKNGFDLYKINGNENDDVFIGNYKSLEEANKAGKELGLEKRPNYLRYAKGGEMNIKDLTNKEVYDEVKSKVGNSVWEQNALNILRNESLKKPNDKFKPTGDLDKLTKYLSKSDSYAKGGMVVTSVKDIPNFTERLEQRRITYRGLGMGKLANDFYKLAGTSGTRIKVDGKEYFITDDEFDKFSRDANGNMRIKFDAPARRGYADGGFLDKYEVDRFKQVMNGKAIAKYIVRLQDSYGNKETYVFGIKLKDQFKGCELVPYESLYGGWSDSGSAFALSNLQVKRLVPNSFSNIELDEQETEMLVNKLVNKNQAGVEKFLNSQFFYLNYNQTFKDVLRGHLALSIARVSSIEFEIVQKFAYGGQVRSFDGIFGKEIIFKEEQVGKFTIGISSGFNNRRHVFIYEGEVGRYGGKGLPKDFNMSPQLSAEFADNFYSNLKRKVENNQDLTPFELIKEVKFLFADGGKLDFKERSERDSLKLAKAYQKVLDSDFDETEYNKYINIVKETQIPKEELQKIEFYISTTPKGQRRMIDTYRYWGKNEFAKGGSVKKDWWQTVVNPNEDFNNYDDKKPIDWEVDDFKSWVVSNSDLDGNVDKEVLEVVKMPKSKLTVEYLNKNGSGKNNNEYYKEFGNWQSALYDIFTQMKKDYLFKKSRKYILKADIKTVTVKRKGKEVTYGGADVLNGAYVLAKGGDMTSKANYVGKNDVVEVELKDGSKVKPANGYWIKKGAEPIGAEPTPTSSVKYNAVAFDGKKQMANLRDNEYSDKIESFIKDNEKKGFEVIVDLMNNGKVEQQVYKTSSNKNNEPKFGETYIKKDMRNNWKAETTLDDFNDYDWRISTIKTYSGKLVSSAQGGKTEPTGSKGIQMWKYTMYQDPNHTLEVSTPKRLTEKLVTEQHEKALAKFKKFMETGMFKGGGKISNFDKLSAKVAKNYEGKPVKSQYQEEYGKYYSKEEAQEVGDKVAGKVKAMQPAKKEMGGETKKMSNGREMLIKANQLAKEIRKDGESWNDAKKRAFAQLKK